MSLEVELSCDNCNNSFKIKEDLFRMSEVVYCPICCFELKNRYDVLNSNRDDKLK